MNFWSVENDLKILVTVGECKFVYKYKVNTVRELSVIKMLINSITIIIITGSRSFNKRLIFLFI